MLEKGGGKIKKAPFDRQKKLIKGSKGRDLPRGRGGVLNLRWSCWEEFIAKEKRKRKLKLRNWSRKTIWGKGEATFRQVTMRKKEAKNSN